MIRRIRAVVPRRVAATIAAVLLLATSCALSEGAASERRIGDRSAASNDGSEAEPADGSNGGDAAPGSDHTAGADGSTSSAASLLPPSVSQVWEAGETGLFVTAADGRTEVMAFDLTTGIELYRVDTHPAGGLRGLGASIHVDEERNVFLAPAITERFGDLFAHLVAYDIDDGDEVWDAEFPIGGTPLFACGVDQVCARGDQQQARYSVTDGEQLATIDATAGTVIASEGEHLIAIARDGDDGENFLGLVGYAAYGESEQWVIDTAELESRIGTALDPGWGWNSDVDAASGIAALTVGNADPGLIGGAAGVDLVSGRMVWARSGVADCVYNYPEDRPMLKCLASDDDPALVDRIVRMDPATGSEIWSIDVADPFAPYDVEIVHGSEYLYVWIGEQVLVYGLDDGRPVVTDGPFLCVNSVWTYDVEYHPDDDPWEYFADTVVVLCDADGFLLRPLDVADVLAETDIAASTRVSFDWELRPFVLDAIPEAMIDGDSGEA